MKEIERKYLLARRPDLSAAQAEAVRQGYLTVLSDSTELRLRQKGTRYFLTQKGGEGRVREEREAEITQAQFETFWPATAGRRVEKTRWTGQLPPGCDGDPEARLAFELDVFEAGLAPLEMVEVEFADEEAAERFEPPDWFGREVTEDKRFGNRALAVYGLPAGTGLGSGRSDDGSGSGSDSGLTSPGQPDPA